MIFHEHKCIFIHIPKCAGSSITRYFAPKVVLDANIPNYDILFGWCPERKIYMQHATSKKLLETGLISKEHWDEYFKFTIVRNPWDRAYSDYLWMQKELKVKDSFKNFIQKRGKFSKRLNNHQNSQYRGDHLLNQTDFFDVENGDFQMDFICRFENLENDLKIVREKLNIDRQFKTHVNKSNKRHIHYSKFYNSKQKKLIDTNYKDDIEKLNYHFDDQKTFFEKLKASLI